jgi:hypothetical protein
LSHNVDVGQQYCCEGYIFILWEEMQKIHCKEEQIQAKRRINETPNLNQPKLHILQQTLPSMNG